MAAKPGPTLRLGDLPLRDGVISVFGYEFFPSE